MNVTGARSSTRTGTRLVIWLAGVLIIALAVGVGTAFADIPGRATPRGATPNPGTQEQELTNITFPAPYNSFEFAVTCMACHAGTVDQQVAHGGVWAGTNMASAARDPFFRANEAGVNARVQALTGEDGAGNICFRCHSPNGWYSGRFNPAMAGAGDGSLMIQSIVLSTDGEGILCEFCHRSIGNVTYKRADLRQIDPVWNMMAGVSDWPHLGNEYTNQIAGDPFGDATMQLDDGMSYGGPYGGSAALHFDDKPLVTDPVTGKPVVAMDTTYTGQTYGVYPDGWQDESGNDVSGEPFVAPDGTLPIHFEEPVGPPVKTTTPTLKYDYQAQALSIEHPTFKNDFLSTSEFCGTCHNLTVPLANMGMPEQRTYTEWKYSDYGPGGADEQRCQDCHMPKGKHEYTDTAKVTVNSDPLIAGWFPYAKDRNANGGIAAHKFSGANRDLAGAMTYLYPEVDLEIIGTPTGRDTRVFPGMMSDRSYSWDRTKRNTELSLSDAADLAVLEGPVSTGNPDEYSVTVRVTNKTGHSIPSGYPDGRRMWVALQVTDASGTTVYESGHYDEATAELTNDASTGELVNAQAPAIDASSNAVMIYERKTGSVATLEPLTYSISSDLLNSTILFDNRIPPKGFDAATYRDAGVQFWTFDPVTKVPTEDVDRYPDGQGYDEITYTFRAPGAVDLRADAALEWQTHTREFVEHLRDQDTTAVRPQAPPSRFSLNYPLTPTFLSDVIGLGSIRDLEGNALRDNWGGIAYASWLATGKGAPFRIAEAASGSGVAPATPGAPSATKWLDPVTGLNDPFSFMLTWDPVPDATGYVVWTRYGTADKTASWDRLGVIEATAAPMFHNQGLNVNKTYAYLIKAFNERGESASSSVTVAKTPWDLPFPPVSIVAVPPVRARAVTLSWFDQADNESGFVIERQEVPPVAPFVEIARIPTNNMPGFGGHTTYVDTRVLPGQSYNYRVAAYNASGMSGCAPPINVMTPGPPAAATSLVATAVGGFRADLMWVDNAIDELGYRVERRLAGGAWSNVATLAVGAVAYSDTTLVPSTVCEYRVFAFNRAGDSDASNIAGVTTPIVPPQAPTGLVAVVLSGNSVRLTWKDNATVPWDESAYYLERAKGIGPGITFVPIATLAANTTTTVDLSSPGTTAYTYRVRCGRVPGGVSLWSNEAVVITRVTPPSAPISLRATRIATTRVTLAWMDTATNESGFYVERSTTSALGGFVRIGTTGANAVTFNDNAPRRRATSWYRVCAYNQLVQSAYSPVLAVKVP
ncbi:MAG: hypothetical protein Q7W30_07185 [Coriobacteriia bacterium]|nr:hypothetical protein [Coriobacteriia bacterium]